jgi:hypothetical protein
MYSKFSRVSCLSHDFCVFSIASPSLGDHLTIGDHPICSHKHIYMHFSLQATILHPCIHIALPTFASRHTLCTLTLVPNAALLHRTLAASLPVHLAALLPGVWGRHHFLTPQTPPLVISDTQSASLALCGPLRVGSSPASHIAAILHGVWIDIILLTPLLSFL